MQCGRSIRSPAGAEEMIGWFFTYHRSQLVLLIDIYSSAQHAMQVVQRCNVNSRRTDCPSSSIEWGSVIGRWRILMKLLLLSEWSIVSWQRRCHISASPSIHVALNVQALGFEVCQILGRIFVTDELHTLIVGSWNHALGGKHRVPNLGRHSLYYLQGCSVNYNVLELIMYAFKYICVRVCR